MKARDYVRTKNGKIFKWEETMTTEKFANEVGYDGRYIYINKDEIKKSSPNIIDLIEEQDLIRYRISGDEYVGEIKGHPEFDKYVLHIEYLDTIINLKDLDIVSIVTREQFESMEYKVEK